MRFFPFTIYPHGKDDISKAEGKKGILWLAPETQDSPVDPHHEVPAKHLHVTTQFGVHENDVKHLIGKPVTAEVLAECHDNQSHALHVKLPDDVSCQNEHPHMTISTARQPNGKPVPPVDSNRMLADSRHKRKPVIDPETGDARRLQLRYEFSPFQ